LSGSKRQALGRGLAALLPGATPPPPLPPPAAARGGGPPRSDGLSVVPIEDIHPSPDQPRKSFDDGLLAELAASISTQGILQPLLVRKRAAGGYDLIAGERRWRAAQRAGLHELPVLIKDVAVARAFEIALVENLQRADLNPIEEAEGYARLLDEFSYTQEALASRVGKDRSTVANSLRLLKLPGPTRRLVLEGKLQMGHARALLGLESVSAIERLGRMSAKKGLSVRQVEALVRREREGAAKAPAREPESANARDLKVRLQRALGARVDLQQVGDGAGRIVVHFGSLDELDAILARVLR
jgi:ParB family chromosome partitioning protein